MKVGKESNVRSGPVTTTVRSTATSDKFQARSRLMSEIRAKEFDFTRRPNHLNAATLAALRMSLSNIELAIVDLDLSAVADEMNTLADEVFKERYGLGDADS